MSREVVDLQRPYFSGFGDQEEVVRTVVTDHPGWQQVMEHQVFPVWMEALGSGEVWAEKLFETEVRRWQLLQQVCGEKGNEWLAQGFLVGYEQICDGLLKSLDAIQIEFVQQKRVQEYTIPGGFLDRVLAGDYLANKGLVDTQSSTVQLRAAREFFDNRDSGQVVYVTTHGQDEDGCLCGFYVYTLEKKLGENDWQGQAVFIAGKEIEKVFELLGKRGAVKVKVGETGVGFLQLQLEAQDHYVTVEQIAVVAQIVLGDQFEKVVGDLANYLPHDQKKMDDKERQVIPEIPELPLPQHMFALLMEQQRLDVGRRQLELEVDDKGDSGGGGGQIQGLSGMGGGEVNRQKAGSGFYPEQQMVLKQLVAQEIIFPDKVWRQEQQVSLGESERGVVESLSEGLLFFLSERERGAKGKKVISRVQDSRTPEPETVFFRPELKRETAVTIARTMAEAVAVRYGLPTEAKRVIVPALSNRFRVERIAFEQIQSLVDRRGEQQLVLLVAQENEAVKKEQVRLNTNQIEEVLRVDSPIINSKEYELMELELLLANEEEKVIEEGLLSINGVWLPRKWLANQISDWLMGTVKIVAKLRNTTRKMRDSSYGFIGISYLIEQLNTAVEYLENQSKKAIKIPQARIETIKLKSPAIVTIDRWQEFLKNLRENEGVVKYGKWGRLRLTPTVIRADEYMEKTTKRQKEGKREEEFAYRAPLFLSI